MDVVKARVIVFAVGLQVALYEAGATIEGEGIVHLGRGDVHEARGAENGLGVTWDGNVNVNHNDNEDENDNLNLKHNDNDNDNDNLNDNDNDKANLNVNPNLYFFLRLLP